MCEFSNRVQAVLPNQVGWPQLENSVDGGGHEEARGVG